MQDPYGYSSGNTSHSPEDDAYRNEQYDVELLKSYKELLDCGIITQDEFDAKKKEILNKNRQSAQTPPPAPKSEPATQAWQPQQYDELFRQPVKATPSPAYEPEYVPPRICDKCGKIIPDGEDSCPLCAIRENAAEASKMPKFRGMKWNKFLCVLLLLSGIYYIINAIGSLLILSSACTPELAESDLFGYTGFVGLVFSAVMIALSFVTRSALEWNKKKGPRLLFAWLNMDLITVGAVLAVYVFFNLEDSVDFVLDMLLDIPWVIDKIVTYSEISIPVAIALAIYVAIKLLINVPHAIYYRHRKHIFVY